MGQAAGPFACCTAQALRALPLWHRPAMASTWVSDKKARQLLWCGGAAALHSPAFCAQACASQQVGTSCESDALLTNGRGHYSCEH